MLILGLILLIILMVLSLRMGIEFSNLNGRHCAYIIIAGFKVKKIDLKAVEHENDNKSSTPDDQEYHFSMQLLKVLFQNTAKIFDLYTWSDLRSFWKAFKIMFSNLKLKIHRFDLTIATPDPASTGILYGSLTALGYALYPDNHINLFADFESKSVKIAYRVALTIRPLEVIYNSLRAVSALPLHKMLETCKILIELKNRLTQGASRV